jgi:Zn finger protein HypA/HybF involved in hydrogenase expression
MKKYAVHGVVEVEVVKEVWANSEEEAYDKAYEELDTLNEYCGNGSYDRLCGVENNGESVAADGMIEYNDIELLEDDPDYLECPECGEELDKERDNVFYCWECHKYFNADGEEIYPDEDDEEEEDEE